MRDRIFRGEGEERPLPLETTKQRSLHRQALPSAMMARLQLLAVVAAMLLARADALKMKLTPYQVDCVTETANLGDTMYVSDAGAIRICEKFQPVGTCKLHLTPLFISAQFGVVCGVCCRGKGA